MSVYNVRVYNYADGQQIRIYNTVYNCDDKNDVFGKKEQKRKEDVLQGDTDEEIWDNIEYYEKYLDVMPDETEIYSRKERSLQVSKSRSIQKIYEITRSNTWEYFVTLTFNPDKVNSLNYDEVVKKLCDWLHNFKKRYAPDLKYIIVPELHKSGRYHFHGLFADIGSMKLVDSGKRLPNGEPIYNLGNYNLGFTTATRVKDNGRVSSYITKYISKDLCAVTGGKKRYWSSRNLNKVRIDEYIMTPKEIENILCDLSENITYCKTTECALAGKSVKYIEVMPR